MNTFSNIKDWISDHDFKFVTGTIMAFVIIIVLVFAISFIPYKTVSGTVTRTFGSNSGSFYVVVDKKTTVELFSADYGTTEVGDICSFDVNRFNVAMRVSCENKDGR